MGDKCARITANDADEKVHAAPLALTAHDAIGDVADEDTCKYRLSRKICDMFQHELLFFSPSHFDMWNSIEHECFG